MAENCAVELKIFKKIFRTGGDAAEVIQVTRVPIYSTATIEDAGYPDVSLWPQPASEFE